MRFLAVPVLLVVLVSPAYAAPTKSPRPEKFASRWPIVYETGLYNACRMGISRAPGKIAHPLCTCILMKVEEQVPPPKDDADQKQFDTALDNAGQACMKELGISTETPLAPEPGEDSGESESQVI